MLGMLWLRLDPRCAYNEVGSSHVVVSDHCQVISCGPLAVCDSWVVPAAVESEEARGDATAAQQGFRRSMPNSP